MAFRCPWCDEQHESGEPGFRWPDAVYALSLPEDERGRLQEGENEDVCIVRDSFFVRGVAFIPLVGSREAFGIGFWLQISAAAFAEFEARGRASHPAYPGRVANQSFFLAPTLGIDARMEYRGDGWRPTIILTGDHPLSDAQRTGVSEAVVRGWLAAAAHGGEKEPPGEPFVPKLEKHGWALVDPREAGRAPAKLGRAPAPGDNAKVIVAFEGSDEVGDTKVLTAGWWVELDEVSRPDVWGGTLANRPRVPAPIVQGSRIWIRAAQVIEYASPTSS